MLINPLSSDSADRTFQVYPALKRCQVLNTSQPAYRIASSTFGSGSKRSFECDQTLMHAGSRAAEDHMLDVNVYLVGS